ncbi:MAG TPA: thiamine pyrophosphate-requiring protein [Myxococcota bacterium]|nr:thiamine pyrophosphate-requiring protein [Myxococcota bacterium]
MSPKVSDFILQRLVEWGVKRVYAYPGDGINGLLGAFGRIDGALDFVQVRHEEMAAFMACAHAKFTGEVGVCMATSGPGGIHLLNGLYDAKLDRQPVVAIVGQSPRSVIGGDYQQEVDLQNLFKDVAHEFVQTAMSAVQIRHLVDRAFRSARATRSPTAIILPIDVQELEAVPVPRHAHGTVHSGLGYVSPRVTPCSDDLREAARILNEGDRVAMLVGAGCLGAGEEVAEVAELLGAGVAKALLGKAVLPDHLPWVTGSIGLLGTKPSYDMMMSCDTLLMVGSSFPYAEFLPEEGQARGIQIDIDGRMLSIRYPMRLALIGDAKETLRALIPLLERKQERGWRTWLESQVERWWQVLEARALDDTQPINPQRVYWELSQRLPDGAILTADSGTCASWFARDLRVRDGMMATVSGNLATMGCGVPYAIAAKFAHPDRVAVATVGDGAMQMTGNAELVTVAKYWREWSDPRLVVLVLNNRDLNMVTWEMRVFTGEPKYQPSQDIPDFPYASYARSLGLGGIRVEKPSEIGAAWDEAFASDRPFVLEVVTDPNVPPLPPHISFEQGRHYMRAITHGDPDAWGTVRAAMREVVESFRPLRGTKQT